MGKNFVSGLVAGTMAAVIWTSFCLLFGVPLKITGGVALIFLVVGVVGTTLIANAISKAKGGAQRA